MNELENWKANKDRIGFNEWEILEGLIVRQADIDGMQLEGNIDDKFCIFEVLYENEFDGVWYHTTIELIKEGR